MFTDICFPKGNENEFVEIALKLGTKSLIFVYDFKNIKDFDMRKKELKKIKKIKINIGVLVDEKSVLKLPSDIEYIFTKSPSRSLVENKKSHILFDFEDSTRKDFIHHRNSGLNQVFCALIKENNKVLGFSFSSLLNLKNPGVLLGRMQQNARLARKYNLKTIVASFAQEPMELRAQHEIDSFGRILGV